MSAVNKAMVLAAGVGSRLGELTQTQPKCLIKIGETTMLEQVCLRLKAAGVKALVINLHHFSEQIEAYVKEKRFFGLSINFSREERLLGTGGGLKRAKQFFDDVNDLFVHNADIYSDIDLQALAMQHQGQKPLATLAVMKRKSSRYLMFKDGKLCGWQNPQERKSEMLINGGEELAFSGIQIVSSALFKYMEQEEEEEFSIISTYMKAVRAEERVVAYRADKNYWLDMGTPEKLEELRDKLKTSTA